MHFNANLSRSSILAASTKYAATISGVTKEANNNVVTGTHSGDNIR
jgi:hypothetical protein